MLGRRLISWKLEVCLRGEMTETLRHTSCGYKSGSGDSKSFSIPRKVGHRKKVG